MATGMTMTMLAVALIAGTLCGGETEAGDLGGLGLRQPLGSGQLRPSISRPSMMQDLGVPSAPPPAAQPQPQYGFSPPAGGAPPAPWGGTSPSATGTDGGFGPPGAASAGAGMDSGAAARRAMGLDPGRGDGAATPLPPGAEQGLVVRRAMGVNDVPGAASPDGELAPGVGAGDVVRKAMGIDDSGGGPLPGRAAAVAAKDDSASDLVEQTRPRQRATIPAYGRRPPPDTSFRFDWDTVRSVVRGGISNLLAWISGY